MQETSVHIVLSRVRTFDPGPRLCSPCGQYIQSLEFETVSGVALLVCLWSLLSRLIPRKFDTKSMVTGRDFKENA
jgi:hypothetical protein